MRNLYYEVIVRPGYCREILTAVHSAILWHHELTNWSSERFVREGGGSSIRNRFSALVVSSLFLIVCWYFPCLLFIFLHTLYHLSAHIKYFDGEGRLEKRFGLWPFQIEVRLFGSRGIRPYRSAARRCASPFEIWYIAYILKAVLAPDAGVGRCEVAGLFGPAFPVQCRLFPCFHEFHSLILLMFTISWLIKDPWKDTDRRDSERIRGVEEIRCFDNPTSFRFPSFSSWRAFFLDNIRIFPFIPLVCWYFAANLSRPKFASFASASKDPAYKVPFSIAYFVLSCDDDDDEADVVVALPEELLDDHLRLWCSDWTLCRFLRARSWVRCCPCVSLSPSSYFLLFWCFSRCRISRRPSRWSQRPWSGALRWLILHLALLTAFHRRFISSLLFFSFLFFFVISSLFFVFYN